MSCPAAVFTHPVRQWASGVTLGSSGVYSLYMIVVLPPIGFIPLCDHRVESRTPDVSMFPNVI